MSAWRKMGYCLKWKVKVIGSINNVQGRQVIISLSNGIEEIEEKKVEMAFEVELPRPFLTNIFYVVVRFWRAYLGWSIQDRQHSFTQRWTEMLRIKIKEIFLKLSFCRIIGSTIWLWKWILGIVYKWRTDMYGLFLTPCTLIKSFSSKIFLSLSQNFRTPAMTSFMNNT